MSLRIGEIVAPMAEMADRIASFDWAATKLSPRDSWPESLRVVLGLCMDTPFPMAIMWGSDLIQLYNEAFIPILGERHPHALGRPAAECWADVWESVGPMLRAVIERGECFYHENLPLKMFRHGTYEDAYFTFAYSPIRRGDTVEGLACIVNETTAQVLRERETAERIRALAEIDRAKTQFFHNVSHEFRTPLTLMLGPLEELVRTLPEYEKRQQADLARRNAVRLQKLVNSLLDFSAAESGLSEARREPLHIDGLTADIMSEFRSAYEAAGLTLRFEGHVDGEVAVDRVMYEKIVLNLLSNALKFTFEGGVEVTTAIDEGHFTLRVVDTGVGIPADELPRLFERFRRVNGSRARTHEGSGIGLALAHELVTLHGGTIAVESVLGRGTAFTVRLPVLPVLVKRPSHAIDTAALRAQFREEARSLVRVSVSHGYGGPADAPRLLIADDNADLRDYLARILGARYRVQFVADGAQLIERAKSDVPDLIVADLMMPRVDGAQAITMLRNDPVTANIPIVLLSARAGVEAAADGFASGADDYIVKPFVAADLLARVDALLRRMNQRASEPLHVQLDRREAELLSAAADRFIAAIDSDAVGASITSVLTADFADWTVVHVAEETGDLRAISVRHREPVKRELGEMLEREYRSKVGDGSPLGEVFAQAEPAFVEQVSLDVLRAVSRDERHFAIVSALGLHSAIVVPILREGSPIASITVVRAEEKQPFAQRDVAFMQQMAARAALAFENARLYERERTIASTLQRALLPGTLPVVPGLRFSASYAPAAEESLMGGGWYDAFLAADGRLIVSIGDVVGHGLHAATVMATLRHAVRGYAVEDPRPAALLTHLNRVLLSEGKGRLATAFIASIDPQTLQTRVASAGHPDAIRLSQDGSNVGTLHARGLLLGFDERASFEEQSYQLDSGDLLALYTDGFVEHEHDMIAGEERLRDALCAARGDAEPATRVHLDIFGIDRPRDDAALLTVLVEHELPVLNLRITAVPESVGPARLATRRFLAGARLSDDQRFEMLHAVGEAVVNAIEHAYGGGDCSSEIVIVANQHENTVLIDVQDFGGWQTRDSEETQRGYGMPLMHSFAEQVDVERSPFGTRVRLLMHALEPAPV